MSKIKTFLFIVIAFLLGTVFSGIVITQVLAHGGNLSLIHACVKTSNGSIRIVGANDICSSNETALDWSKGGLFSEFPVCPNCDLTGKVLTGLNLTRAYFPEAKLTGLDLSNTIFTNANLANADLQNTNLNLANLSGASLDGANLSNTNLNSANLSLAFLDNANLTGANMTNASLANVSLGRANLNNANLSSADLSNTNLSETIFTGANLRGVQWNGASMPRANLSNADLTGSLNFDTAYRHEVVYSNTICPDGTNSDSNGNTCEGHLTP